MSRFDAACIAILCGTLLWSSCDDPAKVVEPPPPPCANCANSEDELIQLLATSYRDRDRDRFSELFPADTDSTPYSYNLNAPVGGIDHWDVTEELRIHRRMFEPQSPLPDENPVPGELWLLSITINLARTAPAWVERTDLYKTPANPNGLDAAKWKATEAEFHADILFETQSDTDYQVNGRVNFILIQDLAKSAGASRRFLIYRWEDLDPPPPATQASASDWSTIKGLYR